MAPSECFPFLVPMSPTGTDSDTYMIKGKSQCTSSTGFSGLAIFGVPEIRQIKIVMIQIEVVLGRFKEIQAMVTFKTLV